ncbi:CheR family methyltransferase [Paenibacillus chartarius]|uniref:CheR family methyltransferase n=1 Tax=Paenibacillus chartarius TaxID=747481 RepID=A0ABV6DG02_9BACL
MNDLRRLDKEELEKIEISLLLEAIYRYYGHDFRNYKYSSIRRRIWHRISAERLHSVSGLQEKVLHDPETMNRLFMDFSINVTEMFRDPTFFAALRNKVFPALAALPAIRIWCAGCSTGEEAYSVAIALHEEGFYPHTTIYGTDMNRKVVEQAAAGRVPLLKMQQNTKNYLASGGKRAFSEYYSVRGDEAVLHPFLSENLVFSQHNLVTDHSFNEFHLIVCRNVLIYFNEEMQTRVLGLIGSSMAKNGFLALGRKEGIPVRFRKDAFDVVDIEEKIYRSRLARREVR